MSIYILIDAFCKLCKFYKRNRFHLCWQDLERLLESDGGIREREPFFLSGVQDVEVKKNIL